MKDGSGEKTMAKFVGLGATQLENKVNHLEKNKIEI